MAQIMNELPSPPRWPLWLAGVASIVWLLIAAVAMAPFWPGVALPPVMDAAAVSAGVALSFGAPLAVIWLVALRLRDSSARRAEQAALMAAQTEWTQSRLAEGSEAIATLEARLSDLTGQLTAMAKPVERQHKALAETIDALQAASVSLTDASGRTEAATQSLGRETPAATQAAHALTTQLTAAQALLAENLTAADAMLANLAARLAGAREEATATATAAAERIAAIEAATHAAHTALETPLAALSEGVDAALTRTAEAVEITREGVHAQTSGMLASVEQARTTIEHIGGAAARAIAERLDAVTGQLTAMGETLNAQAGQAATLMDTLEARAAQLEAALTASLARGDITLENSTARIADVQAALAALATPIETHDEGLAGLAKRLSALDGAAATLFDGMGETVPAMLPGLDDLLARLVRLQDETAALNGPMDAAADSFAQAQARLQDAQAALETAAATLETRLAAAEASVATLTAAAEGEALTASATLLDAFSRIREVASQSAGQMRETLSGVVAEAEAALDRAGSARAEAAFGAPVRTAIAALEVQHGAAAAAAQAAAERVTNRLLALTKTVQSVETHFDKRQTEMDIRVRSDLAKRAATLIAGLQDQAIDLTRLLALDIRDEDYQAWLSGDRSRFMRSLANDRDGDTARAMSRHMAHDPAFRTEATRFVDAMEALIAHVTADPMGRALAALLLASDPGKLYLLLSSELNA